MASPWGHFPNGKAVDGEAIQFYDELIKLWRACDEKEAAVNGGFFPGTGHVWYEGPIAELTATTLRDDTLATPWDDDQWITEAYPRPATLDVILARYERDGCWKFPKFVRRTITGNTGDTLSFADCQTYLNNVPALPGANYYWIIKSGNPFKHDRVPGWPNSTTDEWAVVLSATEHSITVDGSTRRWSKDQWKNFRVYYQESDDHFWQATITGHDRDGEGNHVITFSEPLGVAAEGLAFAIVEASKLIPTFDFRPNRQPVPQGDSIIDGRSSATPPPMQFSRWWAGATDSAVTHKPEPLPDGSPGTVQLRAPTVSLPGGAIGNSDQDYWTSPEEGDQCISPGLYTTFRGVQNYILGRGPSFLHRRDYRNWPERALNDYTDASFLALNGINGGTYTTGATTMAPPGTPCGLTIVGMPTAPYTPIQVFYTTEKLLDWSYDGSSWTSTVAAKDKGIQLLDGTAWWNGTQLFEDEACTTPVNMEVQHSGQRCYVTYGPTRKFGKKFRWMYDKTCFIPWIDATGETPVVIDPPVNDPDDPDKVGFWNAAAVRSASTKYVEAGENGALGTEVDDFVDGEQARYLGDNWCDPVEGGFAGLLSGYFANFHTARKRPNESGVHSGTVADPVTVHQFTDSGANWWPNGSLVVHGPYTPTAMSETSMADENQGDNNFFNNPDAENRGRFAGFMVEIWQPGAIDEGGTAGPFHGVKRAILTYTKSSTPSWTFEQIAGLESTYTYLDAGAVEQTGDTQYRISEPKYELNRWKGRRLRVQRSSDDAWFTATITNSDDDTLVFGSLAREDGTAGTYTPVAGDSYQIVERMPGTIWKWDAVNSRWMSPLPGEIESDADQRNRYIPTTMTRYGRLHCWDYLGQHFFQELRTLLDAMTLTQKSSGWTADGETNYRTAGYFNTNSDDGGGVGNPVTYAHWNGVFSDDWANPEGDHNGWAYQNLGGDIYEPPQARGGGTWRDGTYGDGGGTLGPVRIRGKQTATGIPTRLSSASRFAVYTTLDPDDNELGENEAGDSIAVFEDFGDPVHFRSWGIYDGTVSNDADRISVWFGSLDYPEPDEWLWEAYPAGVQRQYFVKDQRLILDWSVDMYYLPEDLLVLG